MGVQSVEVQILSGGRAHHNKPLLYRTPGYQSTHSIRVTGCFTSIRAQSFGHMFNNKEDVLTIFTTILTCCIENALKSPKVVKVLYYLVGV